MQNYFLYGGIIFFFLHFWILKYSQKNLHHSKLIKEFFYIFFQYLWFPFLQLNLKNFNPPSQSLRHFKCVTFSFKLLWCKQACGFIGALNDLWEKKCLCIYSWWIRNLNFLENVFSISLCLNSKSWFKNNFTVMKTLIFFSLFNQNMFSRIFSSIDYQCCGLFIYSFFPFSRFPAKIVNLSVIYLLCSLELLTGLMAPLIIVSSLLGIIQNFNQWANQLF